jgi:hypothetical protein
MIAKNNFFYFVLLLPFVYFFPLTLNFSEHIATGDGSRDGFQFLWNFWWTKQAVLQPELDLYFTKFLFWPNGTPLLFHTLSPGNGFISIPIQLIWPETSGLIASLNILTLLQFSILGFSVQAICKHLGTSTVAAWTAAILAMFLPFRFYHVNHINLISHGWLSLCLFFLLKECHRENWKNRVGVIITAALTLYSDHGLSLQLAIAGLAIVCWNYKRLPIESLIKIFAGTLVLSFPFLLVLAEFPATSVAAPDPNDSIRLSANLLAIFSPAPIDLIGSQFSTSNVNGVYGNEASFGVAMLIALCLSWCSIKEYKRFLWGGLGILILALGPILHIGSSSFDIWMPYQLLQQLPGIGLSRAPVRLLSTASIFLCIAVAIGISQRSNRLQWFLFGLCLVLRIPNQALPTTKVIVPDHVEALAKDERSYAIIQGPVTYRHKQTFMFWQTVHNHPISTGFTARKWQPAERWIHQFQTLPSKQWDEVMIQSGFGVWFQHAESIEEMESSHKVKWVIEAKQ